MQVQVVVIGASGDDGGCRWWWWWWWVQEVVQVTRGTHGRATTSCGCRRVPRRRCHLPCRVVELVASPDPLGPGRNK